MFKTIYGFPGITPEARLYVHQTGLETIFKQDKQENQAADPVWNARTYFMKVHKELRDQLIETKVDFLLAAVWGDETENAKVVDIFAYRDVRENWPGNPDVSGFVVKNGILVKENPLTLALTCGETIEMLGQEETYRQTTSSLSDYISKLPDTEVAKIIGEKYYR